MNISENIKKIQNDCHCGDIVQFEGKICMVVRLKKPCEEWTTSFGLLCVEGHNAGDLLIENVGLLELDKVISGVLVSKEHVVIDIKKEGVQ